METGPTLKSSTFHRHESLWRPLCVRVQTLAVRSPTRLNLTVWLRPGLSSSGLDSTQIFLSLQKAQVASRQSRTVDLMVSTRWLFCLLSLTEWLDDMKTWFISSRINMKTCDGTVSGVFHHNAAILPSNYLSVKPLLASECWMFAVVEWNLPDVQQDVCLSHTWAFSRTVRFWKKFLELNACHLSFRVSCPPAAQTSAEDILTSREASSLWLIRFDLISSFPRSKLSSAWTTVFAKVSLRSKWIPIKPKGMWTQVSLGSTQSSVSSLSQSLSLSFFSIHRLNKTICGWNNYLNAGDLIPHRTRSHFQVDVRSWRLQFHCRWWEWVEKNIGTGSRLWSPGGSKNLCRNASWGSANAKFHGNLSKVETETWN